MDIINKLDLFINESPLHDNVIYRQVVVHQSYDWKNHKWFDMESIFFGYNSGVNLAQLLKSGIVKKTLEHNKDVEVKGDLVRLTHNAYERERKATSGYKLTARDLGS